MDAESHMLMWEYVVFGVLLGILVIGPVMFDFHWFFKALFWGLAGFLFLKRTVRVFKPYWNDWKEARQKKS
jgi:hypothetical protein